MDRIQLTGSKQKWIAIGLLAVLALAAGSAIVSYLRINFSINNLALLMAPLIIYVKEKGNFSARYAIPATVCILFYFLTWSPFFLVVGTGFVVFLIMELTWGKVNALAPFVLLLLTPLVKYFFDVSGFWVRLQLTALAAQLLGLGAEQVNNSGNMIEVGGNASYAVDAACMGLKLVITSLLMACMLISFFERKSKKSFSVAGVLWVVGFTLILVVFSNLIRIILLVILKAPAETFLHEFTGIACLLVLVLLPLFYIVNYISRLTSAKGLVPEKINPVLNQGKLLALILTSAIAFYGFTFHEEKNMEADKVAENVRVPGYKTQPDKANVTALVSPYSLIYIKPKRKFYQTNHEPFICWRGLGYEVSHERIVNYGEHTVCFALLSKPGDSRYTAWWYDNGTYKSAGQFDWRWKTLAGEKPFRLINITCSEQFLLEEEVERFLKMDLF